jgi:hypothetical protein
MFGIKQIKIVVFDIKHKVLYWVIAFAAVRLP